jgi:hypothetical protein
MFAYNLKIKVNCLDKINYNFTFNNFNSNLNFIIIKIFNIKYTILIFVKIIILSFFLLIVISSFINLQF